MQGLKQDEKGSIVLLWATLMSLLIGFIGVGVEVNSWYRQKSDLQKVADAAAVAAAEGLSSSGCGQYSASEEQTCLNGVATNAAAADGFNSTANPNIVVSVTPNYAGNSNEVRVCIALTENRLFASVTEGNGTVTISSCAAAKSVSASCPLYPVSFYDPAGGYGLFLGSEAVNMGTCGALLSQGNLLIEDNAANPFTAAAIYAPGGTCTGCTPTPSTTIPTVTDPVAALAATTITTFNGSTYNASHPDITAFNPEILDTGSCSVGASYPCCDSTNTYTSVPITGPATLSPGCYPNGFFFGSGTFTLQPGTYFIGYNSFIFAPNAAFIQGTGVTLVFNSSTATNILIGSGISLTAPTTGMYKGIAIYGPNQGINFNAGSWDYEGIVYMPQGTLLLGGPPTYTAHPSSRYMCMQMVAKNVNGNGVTFNLGGTGTTSDPCDPSYQQITVPGSGGGSLVQ